MGLASSGPRWGAPSLTPALAVAWLTVTGVWLVTGDEWGGCARAGCQAWVAGCRSLKVRRNARHESWGKDSAVSGAMESKTATLFR